MSEWSHDDRPMIRVLSSEEMRVKCHIGERARCCKYLGGGAEGFQCLFLQPRLRKHLDARTDMNARSGPCADPYDAVSEAAAYEAPEAPVPAE